MLNIFIQHLYPMLTDTYKKDSTINYKQLTRENLQEIEEGQNVV